MDKDEYLRLTQMLVDEQYDTKETDEEIGNQGIIIRCERPSPRLLPVDNGVADLSNAKANQILSIVQARNNIKVGKFLLRLKRKPNDDVNVNIYETIKDNLVTNINAANDTRFNQNAWAKYFKTGGTMPINELVNVIRWIQVMQKFSAFM